MQNCANFDLDHFQVIANFEMFYVIQIAKDQC